MTKQILAFLFCFKLLQCQKRPTTDEYHGLDVLGCPITYLKVYCNHGVQR
jgi:hypothetical protein